jgi:hypothetical protein
MIWTQIEKDAEPDHCPPRSLDLNSYWLAAQVYRDKDSWHLPWTPTPAQRKAVVRAMRSFVGKHPRYALTGGQGRRQLRMFDTADPLSVRVASGSPYTKETLQMERDRQREWHKRRAPEVRIK